MLARIGCITLGIVRGVEMLFVSLEDNTVRAFLFTDAASEWAKRGTSVPQLRERVE